MKKYLVFGEEYETISEAVEAVMDALDEDKFEEYLYEEYGYSVDICGEDFDPVEVLRDYDSSLYDDKYEDWKREAEAEVEDTIDLMEEGDVETLYGIDIECIYDEDEEEEPAPAPAPVSAPTHTVEDEMEFDISEALFAQGELAAMLANIPSVYVNKDELNKKLGELYSRLQNLAINIHTVKERSS